MLLNVVGVVREAIKNGREQKGDIRFPVSDVNNIIKCDLCVGPVTNSVIAINSCASALPDVSKGNFKGLLWHVTGLLIEIEIEA